MIAAKAKGELLDRYKAQVDRLGEDATESELIRELLREGLDAKEAPLFARIDLPDKYAARVEDAREVGESDEELLRRLLRDLVQGWDDDVLDDLDASDELRQRVEAEREEGESLDGAVERLLRRGLDVPTGPLSHKARMAIATGFCVAGGLAVYAWVALGPPSLALLAAFVFTLLGVYPQIEDAVSGVAASVRAR